MSRYTVMKHSSIPFTAWLLAVLFNAVAAFSPPVLAQTCLSDVQPNNPTAEFTIHSDGTATHSDTGLTWDRCTWGLSGGNCENGSAGTYTWENALQQAEIANQQAYKGHTDWRLPTKRELQSLVEYQCYAPAINTEVFPATPSSYVWSGSPNAYDSDSAWGVDFKYGNVNYNYRSYSNHVRLVRGGQSFASLPNEAPQSCNAGATALAAEFALHADGTTTHVRTGLMWDRCTWGQTGSQCETGSAGAYSWEQAKQQATIANQQAYKGYSDWRVPSIEELLTLTEEACDNPPAINTSTFPNTPNDWVWSGSPNAYRSYGAWGVNFLYGYGNDYPRNYYYHVRLVRGGQSFAPLPAPNQAPLSNFSLSASTGTAPLSVTLDAASSQDPDGDSLSYAWDTSGVVFGGGAARFTHVFAPGDYQITLTVTDSQGESASSSQSLSVSLPPNQAPLSAFSLSASTGTAPLSVTLDAASSQDPDGDSLSYAWDASGVVFGGGVARFTHVFEPGDYQITLTVTDSRGESASSSQSLSVSLPAVPHVSSPELTLYLGDSQNVTAQSSAALSWTSADPAVATISPQGLVTARALGGTRLTVTDAYHQSSVLNVRVVERPVNVPVTEGLGRALVVAGGGSQQSNTLFDYTHRLTQYFYRMLRSRGFADDEIVFMSPLEPDSDGDGFANPEHRNFYLHNALNDMQAAFAELSTQLQAGQQFVFYLHGHGDVDKVRLNGSQWLEAAQLRAYLDSLPAGVQQIVILDACYSGSFLDDLAAPERVILTAAEADKQAWSVEVDGFSQQLIKKLWRGSTVADAFRRSREQLNSKAFRFQQPQWDDDGDGVTTSRDGIRAERIYIAGAGIGQEALPQIISTPPRQTLAAHSAQGVLWLTTDDNSAIRRAQVSLMPPDYQIPQYEGDATLSETLPTLEMLFNPAQQRYEAVFNAFYQAGEWRAFFQVENNKGIFSDVVPTLIEATGVSAVVDVQLNLKAYVVGDHFRLDVAVAGNQQADLYVALLLPDQTLMFLSYPAEIQNPLFNPQAFMANIALNNTPPYRIFDFVLPASIVTGTYTACAGLTPVADTRPIEAKNWLHLECEVFDVR